MPRKSIKTEVISVDPEGRIKFRNKAHGCESELCTVTVQLILSGYTSSVECEVTLSVPGDDSTNIELLVNNGIDNPHNFGKLKNGTSDEFEFTFKFISDKSVEELNTVLPDIFLDITALNKTDTTEWIGDSIEWEII